MAGQGMTPGQVATEALAREVWNALATAADGFTINTGHPIDVSGLMWENLSRRQKVAFANAAIPLLVDGLMTLMIAVKEMD